MSARDDMHLTDAQLDDYADGEMDGADYNFVTRQRFESMIEAGEFLEWASLFGNLYGTCESETERELASGASLDQIDK